MPTPIANARLFLQQKLRETIAECGVPALAAVLVRDEGATTVSSQQGIRKVGATGNQNKVLQSDRFNTGSVSKVFTGNLMGELIESGIGSLQWTTKLIDVFPSIGSVPGMHAVYKNVTIQQFLVHTSGMPIAPVADNANAYLGWTAADLTKAKLMQRREDYVEAAVKDAPLFSPGQGVEYGGGGIICVAMAEKRTGKTYEELLQERIYGPLGMTNSGVGELSPGALDGPWQHGWDGTSLAVTPDQNTKKDAWSWHPRNPAGAVCCSAADMGKFLREQVRPDPQVFTPLTRASMQIHQVTPASSFVRGAWSSSNAGSALADIAHNGSNGVSYAHMEVALAEKAGYGAMSNVNIAFGAPAVNELIETMKVMHSRWTSMFADPNATFHECAHPYPGVALAGQKLTVFARRHDGAAVRRLRTNPRLPWQAAGTFPGAVLTSGLAAGASTDGKRMYAFGRGTDKRIWFAFSTDGGTNWQGWNPIGSGVFGSGPAAAVSGNGTLIHVIATGTDRKIYRTRSLDAGQTWSTWVPIGQGVFTSAPAIAASSDGKIVHVFGRGTDFRIWRNLSIHSGASFQTHWQPIGDGVFTSGPGAASSSNGAQVHVAARGTDRQLWRNSSANSGSAWLDHWQAIPNGIFTSAPALAASSDGAAIHVFAFGGDFRIYYSRSSDSGVAWQDWDDIGPDVFV
jgi:CubicO group peptidase (beta-lactamase class C family)